MKARPILPAALLLVALSTAGLSDRPTAALPDSSARGFDAALVAKGARLAAMGNCEACHTRDGGPAFAGGRPLSTPFGTIYSTNITPDPDSGIGRWSADDFLRAMHEGIDRAGRQLYPAFPYDHFTRVTDADVAAIDAFIMTRDAHASETYPNAVRFPVGFRPLIGVWKMRYFEGGVYRPDPARSAEWNRGAYLVEGLGHCGSCHTPRDALGGEQKQRALEGGDAEGWHAPSLSASSPAPVPWTIDQLVEYLRTGRQAQHGVAAGPMAPVVRDLSRVAPDDVRAIAIYIAARMRTAEAAKVGGAAPASATRGGSESGLGATIFAGACASCHTEASLAINPPTPLALTSSLSAPDPRNTIHIILEGLRPEPGEPGPWMPGFTGALTDAQVAALVDYLRARFTDKPAWSDVPQQVKAMRLAKEDAR